MKYERITIISHIGADLQAFTVEVTEKDLSDFCMKYEHCGSSIRGDLEDIISELKVVYQESAEERLAKFIAVNNCSCPIDESLHVPDCYEGWHSDKCVDCLLQNWKHIKIYR